MAYPNLPDPVNAISASGGGPATDPPAGGDPWCEFQSEGALRSDASAGRARAATRLQVVALSEWCGDEDALALFPSEVPDSPPPDVAPVLTGVLEDRAVSGSPAAGRRTSPTSAVLGMAACLALAAGAALVVMVESKVGATREPLVAAASPVTGAPITLPVATPANRVDDLSTQAEVTEPVELTRASEAPFLIDFSETAAPAALRGTKVERSATSAALRKTIDPTPRGVSRPVPVALREVNPPGTKAGVPAPALPITGPDVEPTRGALAVPENVGTVGVLPPDAAPSVSLPASAPSVTATTVIESVLSRYAAAFTERDVAAARAVWPSVNERGLSKAFESVEEQHFDLGACTISATPPRAVASCDGTARYVPKVGSKKVRSERRQWTFRLEQRGEEWAIGTVDFR